MSVSNAPPNEPPEGTRPAGTGYWFTPLPTYLLDAVYDPSSPINAPAVILWAHIHRNYAWRERIFPSCATLAGETGLGERTVARLLQTLRSAGALTWGASFSSKGRSSNQYALAPFRPFEFDREPSPPEPAKCGSHREEAATSGSHRPAKCGSHPPAKNGRGVKSSSYLESTDEPLSPPPSPGPRPAATPAADERETEAAPPTTTAERVIRTAAAVTPDEEQQFIDWVTTRHTPRGPGWWRTTAANGDLPDLAQTWRTEHAPAATGPALPAWCGQCGDGMPAAQYNPRFRQLDGRACPDCHPDRHAA